MPVPDATISAAGNRFVKYFRLERNVLLASSAIFVLGFGEELWKKFLPKYLEALGAGTPIVGLFGTVEDFLDALYQYPGGWLADHVGRRRAFLLLVGIASSGYIVYLISSSWPVLFIGLALAMAWQSMASPATFAIIGDSLPREHRAMGFTIQSVLKRIPIVLAPILGGAVIARLGIIKGIHLALVITLLCAGAALILIRKLRVDGRRPTPIKILVIWRTFHRVLKRLLLSDIIIRICEGMTGVLIILYVTNIKHFSVAFYGSLVAIQMITSIVVYVPAGKIADRIGRKPFVIATFLCFALFPLTIILASNVWLLILAFVIGGLREIGEPARKAMIVDFAQEGVRARSVGLYYLVRSLSITPAAAIGGLLWKLTPEVPFVVAGIIGLFGALVFALTVEEQYAS